MRDMPCNQVEVRQFLSKYQPAFTRRADGSSWLKWERTWRHATEYFQGLLRPGKSKSVADIADQTATIYENQGGGIFEPVGAGLTGVENSSSDWGDYDGDGDLDLIITGDDELFPDGNPTATIYENQEGGNFSAVGAGLTDVREDGSSDWGDYDGDGDLDLVIGGVDKDDNVTTTIYKNKGGNFSGNKLGLAGVERGFSKWGDFDGEEDLDLIVSGGGVTLYENQPRTTQTQASVTRTFKGKGEVDYSLVALPGQASVALSETVSGSDWRGFRETGASGGQAYSRSECSGGCQLEPGTGFWLIAEQDWQVDRSIETVPLSGDRSFLIDLQDGWNVVSNPLKTDILWTVVQKASGTNQPLWKWAGTRGWRQVSSFSKPPSELLFRSAADGEAYYFRDDRIDQLTIPFPFGTNATTEALLQAKDDGFGGEKRALTLSVVRDGEAVTSVEAGTRPGAEAGLDRYDQYGPPGYFGVPTLRFMQEDPQADPERPTALAAEYRAPGWEGYSFKLRLRAPADTALTLRAEDIAAFSAKEVALVEEATGEAHGLRRGGETVTIVPRSETTRYRLLVGSEAYVEDEKRASRPSEVKLLPNYPNPFSSQTTVEYALPEAQAVRLTVYDVLGRRVATLANGRKEVGFHRVRWKAGERLSSGTYLLRLQAGGAEATRRVTLVR